MVNVPHAIWLALVAFNFIVQLAYFRDERAELFIAKKSTTPLLLLGGFVVLWTGTGDVPIVPGVLLVAMGLGELGIEGSQVVESKADTRPQGPPWTVTAAGVLFLLVNVCLGIVLLSRHFSPFRLPLAIFVGCSIVASVTWVMVQRNQPRSEFRTQIVAYSTGLAVLASGTAAGFIAALSSEVDVSRLTAAAAILVVSDSLVLWRMGASWDKTKAAERRILLFFLASILLLYYAYMATLISIGASFTSQ